MPNTTIHSEYAAGGQGYKLQHIEKIPGATPVSRAFTLRYNIDVDSSYHSQSKVYVEVLRPDAGWVRLADLYTTSLTDAPSVHARPDGTQLAYCDSLVKRLRKIAVQILA